MNAKQYLKQAYKLNELIQDKQDRLSDLRSMSVVSAIDYSKDRVQSSSNNAPFENRVIQIVDLEHDLESDICRLKNLKIQINKAVEEVPDVDCSMLLSKRYILMKTWEQISDEMNYSVSQLHRLHEKALNLFKVPNT